jgi:Flp pilus assembly secretin CpaC
MALVLWRLVLALVFSCCAVAVIAPRQAPAADLPASGIPTSEMIVSLDQAAVVKLPPNVATIVIGNPLIADASLQPGGLMVVTGKGYGNTNFIVLDRAGTVLVQKIVTVVGPPDAVVMYRGIERETYSCAPDCERRITLGDSAVYFGVATAEVNSRNGMSSGAGPAVK